MTVYVRAFVPFDKSTREVLTAHLPSGHAVIEALKIDEQAGLTVDVDSFDFETVAGEELDELGYVDAETIKIMRSHIKELLVSEHEDVAEEAKEFSEALDRFEKLLTSFESLDVYNDEA